MNNLYKKLNKESEHIRLTADEKRVMRAHIFGAPIASPVRVVRSPYVFLFSQRWVTALASLVLVVFAGSSTAFAAQGALPGQPLYALKTKVLEPVAVALASTPAAKAAVHVALAQKRVDEAEALAQKGQLTASTSAELAANFEENAQSADTIAAQIATSDPAVAVQIKTQLNASSAVGGAVLAALGSQHGDDGDRGLTSALAVQVAARAHREDAAKSKDDSRSDIAIAVSVPKAASMFRTFAAISPTSSDEATSSEDVSVQAEVVSVNSEKQSTAAQLEQKAQDALTMARAQFATASSTLDASTTVSVQASLAGIDTLIGQGSAALGSSTYDTAVKDFTAALGRALRLQALLKAQQTFDNHIITPLLDVHMRSGEDN